MAFDSEETAEDHGPLRHRRHRGHDRWRGRQPRPDGQRGRLALARPAPGPGRRGQEGRTRSTSSRTIAASPSTSSGSSRRTSRGGSRPPGPRTSPTLKIHHGGDRRADPGRLPGLSSIAGSSTSSPAATTRSSSARSWPASTTGASRSCTSPGATAGSPSEVTRKVLPKGLNRANCLVLEYAVAILAVLATSVGLGLPTPCQAETKLDNPRAAPTAMAAIELREGLAISGVNRDRRAAIAADPIATQLAAGTWTMPKVGDSVIIAPGQSQRWVPVEGRRGRLVCRPRPARRLRRVDHHFGRRRGDDARSIGPFDGLCRPRASWR